LWPASERLAALDLGAETAMYDILIMRNGVVPMTSRFDLLKVFVVAAAIGLLFYFLAHRGA
jgi:hypothetical protein